MVIHCPHCGSITEHPMLFSITVQRLFNYIWDNPGQTVKEIQVGVYGTDVKSNVVPVHMSRIRKTLASTTYRLHQQHRRYSIKILHPTVGQITKAITSAEVPSNASL